MSQCKKPLDWQEPNINICILEEGHFGLHSTYGLGWNIINFGSPASDKTINKDKSTQSRHDD